MAPMAGAARAGGGTPRAVVAGLVGVALGLVTGGCGGGGGDLTSDQRERGLDQTVSFDPRDAPLRCLGKARVPAAKADGDAIAVRGVPRIRFAPNATGAEAESLAGRAEGAEQLGRALLYVRGASEAELTVLERCLRG